MPKDVDIEALLKANPHIDREELERSRELLQRLRSRGRRGAGYRFAPPFGGRRVAAQEGPDNDPRALRLRQSHDTR